MMLVADFSLLHSAASSRLHPVCSYILPSFADLQKDSRDHPGSFMIFSDRPFWDARTLLHQNFLSNRRSSNLSNNPKPNITFESIIFKPVNSFRHFQTGDHTRSPIVISYFSKLLPIGSGSSSDHGVLLSNRMEFRQEQRAKATTFRGYLCVWGLIWWVFVTRLKSSGVLQSNGTGCVSFPARTTVLFRQVLSVSSQDMPQVTASLKFLCKIN